MKDLSTEVRLVARMNFMWFRENSFVYIYVYIFLRDYVYDNKDGNPRMIMKQDTMMIAVFLV